MFSISLFIFSGFQKSFELHHNNMSASIPSRDTYETARKNNKDKCLHPYDDVVAEIRQQVVLNIEKGVEMPFKILTNVEQFRTPFTRVDRVMSGTDMQTSVTWKTLNYDLQKEGFELSDVSFFLGFNALSREYEMYCKCILNDA